MEAFIKKNRYLIIILFLSVSLPFFGAFYFVTNSFNPLFTVTCGSKEDSYIYLIATEKILELYKENPVLVHNTILDKFINKKCEDEAIKLLSLIGEEDALMLILSSLKSLDTPQKLTSDLDNTLDMIDSIGFFQNNNSVEFLETFLLMNTRNKEKYDNLEHYYFINYSIARSLYLLTGKRYYYQGRSSTNARIPIPKYLLNTRELLLGFDNLKREPEEMVQLLSFFHPKKDILITPKVQ